jgi:predicted transcriptional regulator
MNRYQDALKFVKKTRDEEKKFPKQSRRKYSVLNVPRYDDYGRNYAYFRALFLTLLKNRVDKIIIQVDSGPMIWRICLYQCAEEFQDKVDRVFLYNKTTGIEEKIRIYRKLNTVEEIVLDILGNSEQISISELHTKYNTGYPEKSLSYLLKIVNRLTADGFTSEIKKGREKVVSLSNFGREMFSKGTYLNMINKDLNI